MANTTALYARIDSDLKENAENVLQQLGITPASAIQCSSVAAVTTVRMPFTAARASLPVIPRIRIT